MRYFLFSLFVGVAFGFVLTGFSGESNDHGFTYGWHQYYDYTSVGPRQWPIDPDVSYTGIPEQPQLDGCTRPPTDVKEKPKPVIGREFEIESSE
ncbi:MAG: hypothetical protein MUO85_03180 [candidate division Zixibacteria bacterium]|nr:hypothetical protein [candidate division Zixibacteria bacterium]